jgi:uncharacterized membrane protein (UPF0127 family)
MSVYLFIFYGALVILTPAAAIPPEKVIIETQKGSFTISVEVADTTDARSRGLQNRPSLAADAGMLFDFRRTDSVAMWMKDTLISLDMVFIDCRGRVVSTATHTTPHSLTPIRSDGPALAVLELAAGGIQRMEIDRSTRITHRIFDPVAVQC